MLGCTWEKRVWEEAIRHSTPAQTSLRSSGTSHSHPTAQRWHRLSPPTTMSRQQSPSATSNLYPAHHQHHSGQHHPHHGAPLAPSTSSQSVIAKQRSLPKNYTPGITAGAEDSKYQAKYKELKKKVKEIELVSILVFPYLVGTSFSTFAMSISCAHLSYPCSACMALVVG